MSHKYKFNNSDGIYFVTLRVCNWIDIFTRSVYKDIFTDSLNYCIAHKALEVYAWVIMTNHVHLIVRVADHSPEHVMRDLKTFTSKAIIKEIETNLQESRKEWLLHAFRTGEKTITGKWMYQFWTPGNHPLELVTNEAIEKVLEYIHQNPVKSRLVTDAEYYPYSSAIDFAGGRGLVQLAGL